MSILDEDLDLNIQAKASKVLIGSPIRFNGENGFIIDVDDAGNPEYIGLFVNKHCCKPADGTNRAFDSMNYRFDAWETTKGHYGDATLKSLRQKGWSIPPLTWLQTQYGRNMRDLCNSIAAHRIRNVMTNLKIDNLKYIWTSTILHPFKEDITAEAYTKFSIDAEYGDSLWSSRGDKSEHEKILEGIDLCTLLYKESRNKMAKRKDNYPACVLVIHKYDPKLVDC